MVAQHVFVSCRERTPSRLTLANRKICGRGRPCASRVCLPRKRLLRCLHLRFLPSSVDADGPPCSCSVSVSVPAQHRARRSLRCDGSTVMLRDKGVAPQHRNAPSDGVAARSKRDLHTSFPATIHTAAGHASGRGCPNRVGRTGLLPERRRTGRIRLQRVEGNQAQR